MDWAIDGFDTTIWLGFGSLYGLLNWPSAFDDDLALSGFHEKHGSALPFVIACDDYDFVTFFDVCLDAAHEI